MPARDRRRCSVVISYDQTAIVIQVVCAGLYLDAFCVVYLRRVDITGFRGLVLRGIRR